MMSVMCSRRDISPACVDSPQPEERLKDVHVFRCHFPTGIPTSIDLLGVGGTTIHWFLVQFYYRILITQPAQPLLNGLGRLRFTFSKHTCL